jgi:AAA+ ATPase superfamily predicted ATPase
MLIDRESELDELNALLKRPSARLLAVSGRRRLGKTTLLTHWAQTSNHPYLYWVASHFPSTTLLGQFSRQIWQLDNPDKQMPGSFTYDSWSEAFEALARVCQDPQKHIVIMDEFPYAVSAEPGLPSALTGCWALTRRFMGAWSVPYGFVPCPTKPSRPFYPAIRRNNG